ncbi:MAG TPA: HAMP domain-containing protein [Blastocatellia bacterium]|nr:HAMP domain-containing protein [Blastocatellia bacterium]
MKLNIQNKLIIFAVLAIIVPLGISAFIILGLLSSYTEQRSTERIKSDARVARSIFDKRQENLRSAAQSIAQTVASGRVAVAAPAAPAAPATGGAAAAGAATPAPSRSTQDALKAQLEASNVSFVVVLDAKGKVLAQHNGAAVGDGKYFANNPLFVDVTNAAQKGKPEALSGAVLEDAAVLDATGLKQRAEIKDVASGQTITTGLFVEAAAPVLSGDTVQGVVLIGQLVNNDVAVESAGDRSIVNGIKETLYRDMRDEAAVIIATVADNKNTIVSTNLPASSQGSVAVGVQVKDSGGTVENPSYNEQTFASGAYYTSYVPIEDVAAKEGAHTIGRIGVAIKEEWFTAIVARVRWTILGVTLVALLLAVAGAVFGARKLTRPIVELTEAANRISLGELDVPIAVTTDDEIGTLGESLDRMRISLKQAIERLRKR